MNPEVRILLIEDSLVDAELIEREIRRSGVGFRSLRVDTEEGLASALKDFEPDLVLSDNALPSFDALSALTMTRQAHSDAGFIVVSGTVGEERVVEMLKSGVTDCVLKNNLDRLGPAVRRALAEADQRRAVRAAEESARTANEQFRSAFENAPAGMALIGLDGEFLQVNGELCAVLGRTEAQMLTSTLAALTHPLDWAGTQAVLEGLLTGAPGSGPVERRFLHADGHAVWVLLGVSLLIGADGHPVHFIGQFVDITATKDAENAFEASGVRYRTLLDLLPGTTVFVLDADLRIISVGGTVVAGRVADAPALEGRLLKEVVASEDYAVMRPSYQRALAGEPTGLFPVTSVTGTHWLVDATAIPGENGRLELLVTMRDATDLINAQQALHAAEERFRNAFHDAPVGIVITDLTGSWLQVNAAFASITGYSEADLLHMDASDLLSPEDLVELNAFGAEVAAADQPRSKQNKIRHADGHLVWIAAAVAPLHDESGAHVAYISHIEDITARQVADQALHDSEERFRRVFDEALIGMFLVGTDGNILRVNDTVASLLGREPREVVGQPLAGLFEDPVDQRRILELVQAGDGELGTEMAIRGADGRLLWALVGVLWMTEHDQQRVLLFQVEDVTARRVAEEQLTELALHDELTGLPNRRLLLERCEHAFNVARSGRLGSTSVAALFIDLDGFKPINDRAGHAIGDQLLVAIARDLQAALRPTDTVARVGGDEFVVLLEQGDGLEHLRAIAQRVTTVIKRQHVISDGDALTVTASVGVARINLADEPDASPDQLLRHADTAMYFAKERGRDRHEVFKAELRERTDARQVLAQTLRDGLRYNRIAMVFQPVVDVDSNLVVGAEALMRLTNADGRLMATLPAIVAAEAAGLAEALGDRVLDLALDAARSWPGHLSLAVNISTSELTGPSLRSRVERALQRHDFDPARLILEINESSIVSAGPSAFAELAKLRQRGVRVAIDNFGTAYATLQNLTTLPVDVLKVDRSFTAGLPHQRTHTAIVHAIASMALELDIPCIIEGVETSEQLAAIQGMWVQAQGWLWGQPQGPGRVPMINPVPLPRAQPDTAKTQTSQPS